MKLCIDCRQGGSIPAMNLTAAVISPTINLPKSALPAVREACAAE